MAIRDGRVVWTGVGGVPDPLKSAVEPRDMMGAVVLPGFMDAHIHVEGLGLALEELDLAGTAGPEEILGRAVALAGKTPEGEWIQGRGWDQNGWPDPSMPTHHAMTEALPVHPAFLKRIDGHAALVNGRALDLAGVNAGTPDPEGGRILRDGAGDPTGVLIDTAMDLVARFIPEPPSSTRRRRIEMGLAECARVGLTMIHVAGADRAALAIYRRLREENRLPIRLYVMIDGSDDALMREELPKGPQLDPDDLLIVRAVKLYADGALGSRGAALLEPYSDDPSTRGLLVTDPKRLEGLMRRTHAGGYQCAVHAIGDRANRMVLQFYEGILRADPGSAPRHRIEHAQILSPEDVGEFRALGIVASIQFTHATSDMPWAEERLGAARLEGGGYPWKALLDSGAILAGGSDAPVESPNPFLGLYAGITRRNRGGNPPEGWLPRQRLSPEEALEAATLGAARAAFIEDRLGRLAPGYRADFVVTDTDPLADPPAALLDARIRETWVGGARVFP
jgi:hypothetical protein